MSRHLFLASLFLTNLGFAKGPGHSTAKPTIPAAGPAIANTGTYEVCSKIDPAHLLCKKSDNEPGDIFTCSPFEGSHFQKVTISGTSLRFEPSGSLPCKDPYQDTSNFSPFAKTSPTRSLGRR